MAEYGQGATYWNQRYQNDSDTFEWYMPYHAIEDILSEHITSTSEVLVVGCGTSNLSEDIHDSLSKKVTSIDISSVAISIMMERTRSKKSMKWEEGDLEKLDIGPSTFDVVVDKGTLDSMLCNDQGEASVQKAIHEIHRVLKPGGVFLYITCAKPETRTELFEDQESKEPASRSLWKLGTSIQVQKTRRNQEGAIYQDPVRGTHYVMALTKRSQRPHPS